MTPRYWATCAARRHLYIAGEILAGLLALVLIPYTLLILAALIK